MASVNSTAETRSPKPVGAANPSQADVYATLGMWPL